jgi:hypothetical protein
MAYSNIICQSEDKDETNDNQNIFNAHHLDIYPPQPG